MKPETESQAREKLPYKKPAIIRVRLDPDGTVLTCDKVHGPSGTCNGITGGAGNKS